MSFLILLDSFSFFYNYNYWNLFIGILLILSSIVFMIYKDLYKSKVLKKFFLKYFLTNVIVLLILVFLLIIHPIKTLVFFGVISFSLSINLFFAFIVLARLNQAFIKRTDKFEKLCQILMSRLNINVNLILSSFLAYPNIDKLRFSQNVMISFFTLRFFGGVLRWKYNIGMLTLLQFEYLHSNVLCLSWVKFSYVKIFFSLLCIFFQYVS